MRGWLRVSVAIVAAFATSLAFQVVAVQFFLSFRTTDPIEGGSIFEVSAPLFEPQTLVQIGLALAVLGNFAGTLFFSLWSARNEFVIATAMVLLPHLLSFIVQFSTAGTLRVDEILQRMSITLALILIFNCLAAWLARRHRLRRASRSEQAIIDTF